MCLRDEQKRREFGEDVAPWTHRLRIGKFSVKVLYSSLSSYYANMWSILNKMEEVRYILYGNGIDIFACSESWCIKSILMKLFLLSRYYLYRQDRRHRS